MVWCLKAITALVVILLCGLYTIAWMIPYALLYLPVSISLCKRHLDKLWLLAFWVFKKQDIHLNDWNSLKHINWRWVWYFLHILNSSLSRGSLFIPYVIEKSVGMFDCPHSLVGIDQIRGSGFVATYFFNGCSISTSNPILFCSSTSRFRETYHFVWMECVAQVNNLHGHVI